MAGRELNDMEAVALRPRAPSLSERRSRTPSLSVQRSRAPSPDVQRSRTPSPSVQRSRTPSPGHLAPQMLPQEHAPLLSTFDVFCLIVNKMIGTGIYTNVSTVLVLTGDKALTMTLWALGFLYTLISMMMYLECSTVMPYTGGELVYVRLDELTSNFKAPRIKQLFGDGFYAYVQYAFIFVAFFNSATNSLQIGRLLLVARNPREDPDHDFLRLIAVCAVSLLCMLQYLSPKSGRTLNRWLAVLKILFLFIVLCAGWHAINKDTYHGAGFQECAPPVATQSKIQVAKAFLLVIFSYEGWENATFVAGEIDTRRPVILRKGFLLAVFLVGILYLALVAVFLQAIPFVPVAISYAPMLFGNNVAAYKAWSFLIAISSLGSLNSIIYTFSRIKQSIGSGNILPWSEFWKSDSPFAGRGESLDQNLAPRGGLVLHWIMTVVLIGASASINTVLESVSQPGLLQTYAHCIILTVMGFVILRLPYLARQMEEATDGRGPVEQLGVEDGAKAEWEWDLKLRTYKRWWRAGPALICIVYGLVNLMVIIVTIIPPYQDQDGFPTEGAWSKSNDNSTLTCTKASGSKISVTFPYPVAVDEEDAVRGYILPAATFGVILMASCYYLTVFGSSLRPPLWKWSITHWAGVRPAIEKEEGYDWRMEQIRRFGRRRDVAFDQNGDSAVGILYWLGGGSSLFFGDRDRHPVDRWHNFKHKFRQRCDDTWEDFKDWLRNLV